MKLCNFFSCGNALILVWCKKRKDFCPVWGTPRCDDYVPGKHNKAISFAISNAPEEDRDEQEEEGN